MEIDEQKKDIATDYRKTKYCGKAVDSDHVVVELYLNLKITPTRPVRRVLYKLKNEQGRIIFKQLTLETS